MNNVVCCADDYGLTRGITDTILETVDRGPVRLVSILANGEAVDYAIAEYLKRTDRLALAVHLNLTEGKALSPPEQVPHLVDARGMFRHGVGGLWLAYIFGSRSVRVAFRKEVRCEMAAQLERIREGAREQSLAVNGHLHIYLIPFVFDELVDLPGIRAMRLVSESFMWSGSSLATVLARPVLAVLSRRAKKTLRSRGIHTNDAFIGFLHSGRMTLKNLRASLILAQGSVEVLFHPGSAKAGELTEWKQSRADISWHYSPWRTEEREMLIGPALAELLRVPEVTFPADTV